MRNGQMVLTRSIKIQEKAVKPGAQLSYRAPSGKCFALVLLGLADGIDSFDAESALRELGWEASDGS